MSALPQGRGVGKGSIVDDGIGITAVIREHITGDHGIGLEWVGSGGIGTQPGGFINIGAVRVEPELVELSQASASVEWS